MALDRSPESWHIVLFDLIFYVTSWWTILWNYFKFELVVQEKMSSNAISHIELWRPLCLTERNRLCKFGRPSRGTILWFCFESGSVVQEMSFKDISYLELWQPLCSVERHHLCKFRRRHHEEQFWEIILNLDQWLRRRCRLHDFLSGALSALVFNDVKPFMQVW